MLLAFVLVACAAIQTVNAQSSATVYVQPSTDANSYNGYMSTSFLGLKLPSGSGTHVSITVTPGDYADNSYVTSYADQTQDGPYYVTGPSTSFTIGTAGHYWFYLSAQGTTSNYDYMEIRVVSSTWTGSIPCYYCAPPSGWQSGWPPYGTPLLAAPAPGNAPELPSSQPASSSSRIPTWVIPILAVAIALAVLVPTSYMVYRYVQKKKMSATAHQTTTGTEIVKSQHIELQPVTVV